MKKLSLVFLLLISLQSLTYADIGGFNFLKWGQSKQEVQKHYPNFESWSGQDNFGYLLGGPLNVQYYGLKHHLAAGCDFEVKIFFLDNKLTQVILEQSNNCTKDCYDEVLDELTRLYGNKVEYSKTGKSTDFQTLKWSRGESTIVLRKIKLNEDRWQTAVVYTDSKQFNGPLFRKKQL
jgi:hypothetical protein